ncbi:MAG: ATP-binding protein [Candidatus Paceibacterota bacterium]
MKIRNKINISFIGSFIIISLLIGLVVGIYTTNLAKKDAFSYLHSSNRARAEHIRTFLQDQEKISVILAAASVYRDLLKEPIDSKNYHIIKTKIDKRLIRTIEADPQIFETFILDSNGKVVASSNKIEEGKDKSQDDYFIFAKDKTYIKDVYYSKTTNKFNYTISTPVKDDTGVLLGVSVLRYLPENFFNIVKSENGLGDTEENFLINKDKFFVTPSLFLSEDVILKEKVETKNANDCFDPKEVEYIKDNGYSKITENIGSQILESKDYRNVDVIATHAYIPDTGWCLITKVDKSDLLSFRSKLIWSLLLVLSISILIFILIGIIISKKITNPIKLLKLGAEKIKKGDLDYKVDVNTQDELGELSDVFNNMSQAVKQSKSEIEKKVEEQTKQINEKVKEFEDQNKAILNILEDVEREKSKVEGLANDLEKFKLAVDNASDQVVITDVEGIVVYGNKALERITGFKPEEAMGKKAGVLWKVPMPIEYYQNLWDIIKTQKKVFISEIQNKRKNGELYIANISISPVLDDKNDILYFVAIEHDITKEKEIDKAKTEFVSLASHQLRTPLSSINWYTEMLLAGDAGIINEEQKKYLEEVAIGNKRMVDLVDSLLNVSRLDLGTFVIEPEKTDVLEMIKSVVNELNPQIKNKNLKLEESYGENIKEFEADQKLLRMVFQNLLSNAVKYTGEGGSVKVNISILDKDHLFGGKVLDKKSLAFSVSDSGIGIPENQKDKMFLKLFRADNARESETEGTGLGLYIIKSIIDQSGGMVWFDSEEGKGSTFYVVFPETGMKKKEGTRKLD